MPSIRGARVLVALPLLFAIIPTCIAADDAAKAEPAEAKRYVIIHADDAGMSHTVNQGTIDAMRDGIVSSMSIMVPCPWFPEIADHCKKNPDGDYGIHTTLTSEWEKYRWGPVAPKDQVPSLLDKDGYFPRSSEEVAAKAKAAEVEIELRAQIERAKQFGIPLSHLDTHMGAVLKRADLMEVYVNLALEYDLPILFFERVPEPVKKEYPGLAEQVAVWAAALRAKKLPILDGLHQYYEGDDYDQRKQRYLRTLRQLKPGVTQIIVHCGVEGTELRAITSSNFIRDTDRRIFCDKDVIDEVQKLGIEVITWKKFVEMERANPATN